jgi:hypothetical protein
MRITLVVVAALFASLAPARATIGFACNAEDKALTIAMSGAYPMSLGMGMANFAADLDIRLTGTPPELRKLHLDRSHVSQQWFNGRDLRVTTRWERPDGEPFGEILLVVETRRGKAEESPYRGRYTLQINLGQLAAGREMRILEAGGTVSCGVE